MMSRDRVRFKLPIHRLTTSSQATDYRAVCREVFGTDFPEYRNSSYGISITVICRPSQFARFLILRNKMGVQNQFSELEPDLFTPDEVDLPKIVDVSRNPARGG